MKIDQRQVKGQNAFTAHYLIMLWPGPFGYKRENSSSYI
ncbi:hypothetical protein X474_27855 [Dethiosulfatarculus sandiegensis]|uniref:Uncharacterized protein n=1 Tax=Dethiosulfatarculus sandiegensis TaxID=1429043 RepID=A0A0D2HJF4_9BACT|nr:hypothetical protein X474_27855 [Dethiosulfatarculus sandiegensis]